jgi:hypothetical protein
LSDRAAVATDPYIEGLVDGRGGEVAEELAGVSSRFGHPSAVRKTSAPAIDLMTVL